MGAVKRSALSQSIRPRLPAGERRPRNRWRPTDGSGAISSREWSGRLGRLHELAGGVLVAEPEGVDLGVLGPLRRESILGEDRVHRALGLAGTAVDALVGVDVE